MSRTILRRFLTLALAPLLICAGISLLGDNLVYNGYAQDGNAEGNWESLSCREFWSWPVIPDPDNPDDDDLFGEYLGKEVGDYEDNLQAPGVITQDPEYMDVLTIAVTNAYPSYGLMCDIGYSVTGDMGGVVGAVEFLDTGLTNCTVSEDQEDCDELTVIHQQDIFGDADENGCIQSATDRLIFHVNQPAPQESELNFELSIPVTQCDDTPPGVTTQGGPEDPGGPNNPSITGLRGGQTVSQVNEARASTSKPENLVNEVLGVQQLPETGSGGLLGQHHYARIPLALVLISLGMVIMISASATRRRDRQ